MPNSMSIGLILYCNTVVEKLAILDQYQTNKKRPYQATLQGKGSMFLQNCIIFNFSKGFLSLYLALNLADKMINISRNTSIYENQRIKHGGVLQPFQ